MIELRLLGTLHLTDAAGREVKSLLTRPRRLALLAYLAAATPRGLRRRDTLLALFWPELAQEHARAALRQALHILRGALGADAVVTRGDEEIGLDEARVWCDVAAFDAAVAAEQFDRALELHRGPLPAALEWARRATRLEPHGEEALRTLIALLDRAGDRAGAVAAYDEFAAHV